MAVRLPVTTVMGHVSRAISFCELPGIYFAIGRTTPWPGELEAAELHTDYTVPLPPIEATGLDELIGMKRVSTKSLVVPDADGTIIYRDNVWRRITPEEAIRRQAHWVYIEASIYYDELPDTNYREIGVFTRVRLKEGVPELKQVILPEEIEDTGVLEILDYRKVVTRNEDTKDTFSMIIQF